MPQLLNTSLREYVGVGEYNIPAIQPVHEIPNIDTWLEFEKAKKLRGTERLRKTSKIGVHFFEYDFKFECTWNFPDRYAEVLSVYDAIVTPDYSYYIDFPKALRIYNKYRMHWITAYWQEKGLTVIPLIRIGLEEDWDWCFDGYPIGSIVAVSTVGSGKSQEAIEQGMKGYEEMLKRLEPQEVLIYSNAVDYFPGNVRYIKYSIDKHIKGIDDVDKEDNDD